MAGDLISALDKLAGALTQKREYDADMSKRLGMSTAWQGWPVSLTPAEIEALLDAARHPAPV